MKTQTIEVTNNWIMDRDCDYLSNPPELSKAKNVSRNMFFQNHENCVMLQSTKSQSLSIIIDN